MIFSKRFRIDFRPVRRGGAVVCTALLLSGAFMLTPDFRTNAKTNAELQSEINSLNTKVSKLSSEQKALKSKIATERSTAKELADEITDISYEVDLIDEQIAVIEAMLVQYDELLAAQEVEIAALEIKIADQQHVLDDMIRMSYEYGGAANTVEFIFSAEDFSDLLTRIDLMSYHLSYNDKVLENYNTSLQELEKTKTEYETAKASAEAYRAEQQTLRSELEKKQAQAEALRAKSLASIEEYEKELAKKQAYIDELNNEVKKLADMFAKEDKTSYGGTFLFPLPSGVWRITSYYGVRSDPFTGAKANHTGYDFACAKGTKIYAVDDGTVVLAKYNGSYGNCVTVNHGGGIMSLYGHCSSLNVVAGQTVKRGDVVGYVGSTGRSTGNHLHFSVYKNGKLTDPAPYLGI